LDGGMGQALAHGLLDLLPLRLPRAGHRERQQRQGEEAHAENGDASAHNSTSLGRMARCVTLHPVSGGAARGPRGPVAPFRQTYTECPGESVTTLKTNRADREIARPARPAAILLTLAGRSASSTGGPSGDVCSDINR